MSLRQGDLASVVTEVEFGGVATQMSLAQMVIGADHATLEDREEVLGGVGMVAVAL